MVKACKFIIQVDNSSTLFPSSKSIFLSNILHVPAIHKNFLLAYQFTKDNNVFFKFHHNFFCVKDLNSGAILLKGKSSHGLYPLTNLSSSSLHPIAFLGEHVP